LLGVTFIWAVLLGLLRTADLIPFDVSRIQVPTVSVPPHLSGGLDARLFQQPMIAVYGQWSWAVYQWHSYGGPYIGAGLALAIIALWYWIRSHSIRFSATIYPRDRWGNRFVCLGHSMLAAATILMFVYLFITPSVMKYSENYYQTTMVFMRAPREYINTMTKTMAEVRTEQGQAVQPCR
jgi:hypothetical protein